MLRLTLVAEQMFNQTWIWSNSGSKEFVFLFMSQK